MWSWVSWSYNVLSVAFLSTWSLNLGKCFHFFPFLATKAVLALNISMPVTQRLKKSKAAPTWAFSEDAYQSVLWHLGNNPSLHYLHSIFVFISTLPLYSCHLCETCSSWIHSIQHCHSDTCYRTYRVVPLIGRRENLCSCTGAYFSTELHLQLQVVLGNKSLYVKIQGERKCSLSNQKPDSPSTDWDDQGWTFETGFMSVSFSSVQ